MKNYENYLLTFPYLSYLEKSKFGKWTQRFTKDGFLIYEPYSFSDFERKMDLNTSFSNRWGNKE